MRLAIEFTEMKNLTSPINRLFYFVFLIFFSSNINAQGISNIFQSTRSSIESSPFASQNLVTETIYRIAESRRIFIITNTNQSFNRGDYISLVVNNSELAVRALVAQTTDDNLAGIKILQIYSLTQWNRLREGREVQVIRGDDSFFLQSQIEERESQESSLIQDERDLFDETTFLEDDIIFSDGDNRAITQDNIISAYLGLVEGIDNDNSVRRYRQLNGSWAFQFQDNLWIEGAYGRTVINDFPDPQFDTTFTNASIKIKYTISTPFHSYLKPYVGYQVLDANSPGAGENNVEQARRVDNLKKNELAFGITGLKRLVPGWFIRGDLGSDLIAVGFALEF